MTIYPKVTLDQWQSVSAAILEGRAKKPHPAIGIFGGIVLGAALALLLMTPQTRIAGAVIGMAYALFHFIYKRDYRQRLAASRRASFEDMQPVLNGNRMEIDAAGIRGTWVGGKASYDFSWDAFIKLLDRQNEFVFLYAPCCYINVPKSELAAEEVQQIIRRFEESRPAER